MKKDLNKVCLLTAAAMLSAGVVRAAVVQAPVDKKVANPDEASRRLDAETADAVRMMMRLMRDPRASVQTLLPHLGRVELSQGESGYDIEPSDGRFSHIFLGLLPRDWQTAGTGADAPKETPFYLEVTPSPATALHLASLRDLFGPWIPGTPPPEGNPFVVVFPNPDQQALQAPYQVKLFVDLSGPVAKAGSTVTRLMIRREQTQ